MNQKKIRLIFTILVTAVLITFIFSLVAPAVFAQRAELEYPDISKNNPNGPQPPNEVRTLPNFIRYAFNFGIMIAGLAAFISFVYGGVRYLASAGNPGTLSDAREQIKASLLGLVLLLGSWLLLTTINPKLVILQINKDATTSRQGIILFAGTNCGSTKGLEEGTAFLRVKNSFSDLTDKGATSMNFPRVGSIKFLNSTEEISVTLYSDMDYQGSKVFDSADYVQQQGKEVSGSTEGNTVGCVQLGEEKQTGSVQITWKTPGVYLFAGNKCTGEAHVFTGDTASFNNINFNGKARSLKIIPSFERVGAPTQTPLERFFSFFSAAVDAAATGGSTRIGTLPGGQKVIIKEKLGAVLFEQSNFHGDGMVFLGGDDPTQASTPCIDITAYTSTCPNSTEPYCKEPVRDRTSSIRVFNQAIDIVDKGSRGEGITLFGNYAFNEQDPGIRKSEQQHHCGPISAVTEGGGYGRLSTNTPLWVDGKNQEIGAPTLYPGTQNASSLNCGLILQRNQWVSSIKVAGNYIAVLFRDDGRAEVFKAPGDNRLSENHIGDNTAKYLLVIPTQ